MKKLILSIISLSLICSISVYDLKEVSRVHVMKFTGKFTVIYQDIKLFSDDATFVQSLFFDNITSILIYTFAIILTISIKKSFSSQESYLVPSPRAPPFIS